MKTIKRIKDFLHRPFHQCKPDIKNELDQEKSISSALLKRIKRYGMVTIDRDNLPLVAAILSDKFPLLDVKNTDLGLIKFFAPNLKSRMRFKSMLSKEPETIAWIECLDSEDVFWDIGANIGIFTLYAALKGNRVLSFEPLPANLYLLNKNVELNNFNGLVSAFGIAFSNETKLDIFNIQDSGIGAAMNNSLIPLLEREKDPSIIKHLSIVYSIDGFIYQFNPLFPNHIKIDIDGAESLIIQGAQKTLEDKRLKSILIELNEDSDETEFVTTRLATFGYKKFDYKVTSKKLNNGFIKSRKVHNYIFIREDQHEHWDKLKNKIRMWTKSQHV